jgi:hypothetical protein
MAVRDCEEVVDAGLCLLEGDCDNLALTEANCFALSDSQGRDWLCFETTMRDLSDAELYIGQTVLAQQKLSKLGQAAGGTQVSMHDCRDIGELNEALSKRLR